MTALLIFLSAMVIFTTLYCIFQHRIAPSKDAIDKSFEEVKTKFEYFRIAKSISNANTIYVSKNGSLDVTFINEDSTFENAQKDFAILHEIGIIELHYIIDNFKQIYDKL